MMGGGRVLVVAMEEEVLVGLKTLCNPGKGTGCGRKRKLQIFDPFLFYSRNTKRC